MLKRLRFDVTFPTGKSLSRDIDFPEGVLAITGKNGTGKSLILEMITYAIFGSAATRGSADDYEKCQVGLDLAVKGEDYRIERTSARAVLHAKDAETGAWKVVVNGTSAVNIKAVELFSYALPVFQVANLIGQGQIEALGAMRPEKRKKLVDNVIGLDAIDTVAEWANGEALISKREAEAVAETLRAPETPTMPEGYRHSDGLKTLIEQLTLLKTERDEINGWLAHPVPEPVCPTTTVSRSAEELKASVEDFQAKKGELNALNARLNAIPEAKLSLETLEGLQAELDAQKAWAAYDRLMAPVPPEPPMTLETIQEILDQWALTGKPTVECPRCQHSFSLGHDHVVEEPEVPRSVLLGWQKAWAARTNLPEPPEMPRPSAAPDWTQPELDAQKLAAEKAKERKSLEKQIKSFKLPEDLSADYHARVKYEADLASYARLKFRYDEWLVAFNVKQTRLEEMGEVDSQLRPHQEQYTAATIYERLMRNHEAALYAYQEATDKVALTQRRSEQYKLAVAGLRTLKSRVKGFLVPSLSRVATTLIQQMTEGQHQELKSVVVNEDFEITVDGQSLETLNGSGKTVANLAVRVALGQILTNRVFSVLMADEVDAACDDERAAAIASCLRNLTKTIKQVLIVSHKAIEADHYLVLGG